MKNIIINKITAVFLTLIMIFGLIPSMGFAQSNPALPISEVKGFNISVFDSHFSRADREINPERWLAEAKIGITQAVYAWELIAFGMYENPFVFEEAKAHVEDWSNKELEARFSQWLIKRFFGEAMGKAASDFSSMLGETQKKYTWHLDDEGNVVFDEKTGDPLVIRPGEEGREFLLDRMIWRGEAEELVRNNSGSFDTVMLNIYPELLAYIPAELRDTMSAAIVEAGMSVSTDIKREFENIAAREQRIFTSRRTRDIWSLRKKSDDEAARIFTEQLIAETEQVCARGIEEINTKIEQAYAGTGDLALLGEEWLQLYKEQFDRGLKAWEEAEERFFIRRIEWEQDSFKLFSEGEEIWFAAFDKLNEEYQKWELKAKELFDTGEQLFKNISNNLEKSIADAKTEFEINKNMRVGSGTEKAKALIDMYITSASAAISAKENVQYWLNNYNRGKKVNDPDFANWLWNERKIYWIKLENNYIGTSYYESSLQELTELEDAMLKIKESTAALIQSDEDEDVKKETVANKDIIAQLIKNAEDKYYEYLEKFNEEHKILFQIQDVISGKMTFAEELAFAEETKYKLPLNNYNYSRLCDLQKYYNLYTSYLEIALDSRDKILTDYAEILGTGALKDILSPDASTEDFYLDEYQLALVRAKTLVLYWERKTSIAQAVISYSEKIDAGRMTEAESIQAWEKAKDAYNKSLALYEAELNKLSEIGANIQNQKTILDELAKKMSEEEDKLSRLSQEHSMLVAASYVSIQTVVETDFNNRYKFLVEEYKYFLKTGDDVSYKDVLEYGMNWGIAQQKENTENLLTILINGDNSGTPSLAEIENAVLLKTRLAAIDLFADGPEYKLRPFDSAYSGADWYSKAKGIELFKEEKTALYGEKLGERLAEDLNKSHSILLEKRLDFELKKLKNILDMDSDAKNYEEALASALSELTLNGVEDVAHIYNILLSMKERLDSNKGFFTESNGENEVIEYFILLGSFCINTEQNLINYYNDYFYCSNLLDLYYNYAAISSFGQKEIWQNSCDYIKIFLTDYELDTGKNFIPDAKSIYDAILKRDGKLTDNVILFFHELQKYFSMAPKWLDNEFYFWKNAVIEYIAANISPREDEVDNEKHWRQYLDDKSVKELDSVLDGVLTWEEGIIKDTQFAAAYYTNRLNDAFILFLQTDSPVSTQTAETLYNYYSFVSSDIDNRFYSLNFYYNDMSRLGRALEISKMNSDKAKAESDIVYKELKIQEEKFNLARDNYFTEAEFFLNIGSLYDEQYNAVKKAYEETETKRFEYEKEDAIRRWASTAYLNIDTLNYDDCKNKLEKAQIVLTVLLEINNDKEKRVYDNPEYNALYLEYEQSFIRKIKALDALETISSTLAQEYNNNDAYFNAYRYYLLNLGALTPAYSGKVSIELINDWQHKDIITVKDGKLAFSRDTGWKITSDSNATELDSFFNSSRTLDNERHESSPFEEALRGLSQRMADYIKDPYKLTFWSLAKEYMIFSLFSANLSLTYLPKYLSSLGELGSEGSLGNELYKNDAFNSPQKLNSYFKNYTATNVGLGSSAYLSLSEAEKADLEFYVILTLSGGGNSYLSGFSKILNLDLYQQAYDKVNGYYKEAAKQAKEWYTLWFYDEMKDINKNTLNRIEPVLNETKKTVNSFISGVKSNISSIQSYNNIYLTSCNNIKILNGEKEAGQSVVWDDINNALTITRKFNNEDITILKSCWEKMQETSFMSFRNLNDALTGLVRWTKSEETRLRNDLEKVWLVGMQKQQNNENNYFAAAEAFMSGTGNINVLKAAAENAYGKNSTVQKNHLENIQSALINDLSLYLTMENNHYSEFVYLGREIELLTEKTLENRYAAELAAREIEWNQMRADILVKANEWQNSVSIILENGRTEWDAGKQRMNESYKQWYTNFQNEFRRIKDEWAQAYLAGLEDKEEWLEQAAAAFNQASAESFLQLVGTEGERLSRFMDTREPFGIRNAVPEAQTIMTELLQSSGIVNMTNAFVYMNNITNTAASSVRKGLGGVSSWDAAVAKTAAKDIARKTNAELADAETRKMAHIAGITVGEAISRLYSNVDDANNNFRESMDNQFIMQGLWRKNGKNYEKDIVKGSTLSEPVISKKQTVAGYNNYIMEPVFLKTNLDKKFLAELNTIAIRALIESAYNEIEAIVGKIFGNGKQEIIKKENMEDREQSPGKFGAHIGYQPAVKPPKDLGSTRKSIFYDEGEGEFGRLMSDFIYWKIIDSKGSAELGLAPWDKRMWNDEGSFFTAPSISSTLKIVGAVAAAVVSVVLTPFSGGASLGLLVGVAALTAGINSSTDLLFSSLNFACGYKSFDEALFDFGKASLINTGSAAIGGVFGSGASGLTSAAVNAVGGTAGKIATQTAMAGLQTVTSSLSSNALGAFTYNSSTGSIGWSEEIFNSGMKSMFTDTLTSMASTLTTQTLTAINSGLDMEKLFGFNKMNKKDLGKFNSLAGSLAGQGVNYAMGNDFTLNILNFSLLSQNENYNTGLLELHLGRNGTTMNLGTGGANVSIDNLMSAFKGLQVWDVNSRISRFIKENYFDPAVAPQTQYGFEDDTQENQLWDILKEDTVINIDAEWVYGDKTEPDNNGWSVDEGGNPVLNTDVQQTGADVNVLSDGTRGKVYDEHRDEQMNMETEMQNADSDTAKTWFEAVKENVSAFFKGLVENIGKGLNSSRGLLSILKPKNQSASSEQTLANSSEYIIDISDKVFVPDGDSFGFSNSIMDDYTMWKYSTLNPENKGEPQCGTFVRDKVEIEFGPDVHYSIFEGKKENTNTMVESFKKNENLVQIPVNDYNDLRSIQKLADNGVLVLMIYKNEAGSGHIAFIGNSNMEYKTIYDSTKNNANLYDGKKLENFPNYQLTVVQAGTYTGITNLTYATNGFGDKDERKKLLENNLYFYTVRRR
jgi:hypothetical protein